MTCVDDDDDVVVGADDDEAGEVIEEAVRLAAVA